MDPFLFGAITYEMHKMGAVRETGRQLVELEKQRAWKRKVIKEVDQKTAEILREDSTCTALQAYVMVCLYMHDLEANAIIPDAFEEMEDKETTALVWRKLNNLHNKLSRGLTQEQLMVCHSCLDSIMMLRYLNDIEPVVQANDGLMIVEEAWKSARKERNASILRALFISLAVVTSAILILTAADLLKIINLRMADLILWGLLFGILCFLGLLFLGNRGQKRILKIESQRIHLIKQAEVNNDGLWDQIEKVFGGYPTPDELKIYSAERQKEVKAVFPDN